MRERAIDALLLALTDFGQGSVMVNGGREGRKRSTMADHLSALRLTGANPKQSLRNGRGGHRTSRRFSTNQSPHRTQILRARLGPLSIFRISPFLFWDGPCYFLRAWRESASRAWKKSAHAFSSGEVSRFASGAISPYVRSQSVGLKMGSQRNPRSPRACSVTSPLVIPG